MICQKHLSFLDTFSGRLKQTPTQSLENMEYIHPSVYLGIKLGSVILFSNNIFDQKFVPIRCIFYHLRFV